MRRVRGIVVVQKHGGRAHAAHFGDEFVPDASTLCGRLLVKMCDQADEAIMLSRDVDHVDCLVCARKVADMTLIDPSLIERNGGAK